MLTMEHKSKSMAASLESLCRCQDEVESFMESIVTGDETWVYKFTQESKRNSCLGNIFIHPPQRNSKLTHQQEKEWRPCSGIVKASCSVNFSHQKQQSTATNTVKLLKYCA
jgi:hypothetical protein